MRALTLMFIAGAIILQVYAYFVVKTDKEGIDWDHTERGWPEETR